MIEKISHAAQVLIPGKIFVRGVFDVKEKMTWVLGGRLIYSGRLYSWRNGMG